MKEITCLVVDDERAAVATLESYILATPGLQLVAGIQSPVKALEILQKEEQLPDLVFLDMEMKDISGLQLAKVALGKIMIVFSTAHADFAVQSYELGAVDYLLKPFSYERFLQAIEKCKYLKENLGGRIPSKEDFLSLVDSRTSKLMVIEKNKISYITAFGNYCKVFLEDGSMLMPLKSLTNIFGLLKSEDFLRIHKSWVIHINQVKEYGKDLVTLKDGQQIKLGRTHKTVFKRWIEKHGLI